MLSTPRSDPASEVTPLAVLRNSEMARLGWQPLRPVELSRSSVAVASFPGTPGREGPADLADTPTYNRETKMSRLLKDGERAAKPICIGC
ncbi:hypothetical protein DK389_28125 [Methylobacterium durans]|uniref:Uncharacterized protein n=1 Tax=Methylobacterium durans TaxID=2202825 RepID=A0A2U8WC69_9HYPH|nr:hypothetical protein DK389_28125 [Methylobacterium durans]